MVTCNDFKREFVRPHIVLVTPSPVVNVYGGVEKIFCDMANELSKRGYLVSAICLDVEKGSPVFQLSPGVDFYNAYNYRDRDFLYKGFIAKFRSLSLRSEKRKEKRNLLSFRCMAERLKRILSEIKRPDIFISFHMVSTRVLVHNLKRVEPIVTMFHSQPSFYFNEDKFRYCRSALSSTKIFQVLLPDYKNEVEKLFPNSRIVQIANAVPMYEISSNLKSKKIITVSRIDELKRPDLLIRSFARLHKNYPEWKCEWWGAKTGEYYEKMEALLQEFELEGSFEFKGYTNNVESVINDASIFAFPSALEGFPLALTEAMAMGLPVVGTSDCYALRELIKDGENGLLSDSTVTDFSRKLEKLMNNEDLRLSLGMAAKVDMKNYSKDKIYDRWDNLIRDLLQN